MIEATKETAAAHVSQVKCAEGWWKREWQRRPVPQRGLHARRSARL